MQARCNEKKKFFFIILTISIKKIKGEENPKVIPREKNNSHATINQFCLFLSNCLKCQGCTGSFQSQLSSQ